MDAILRGLGEIWRELRIYENWLIDSDKLGEKHVSVLLLQASKEASVYRQIFGECTALVMDKPGCACAESCRQVFERASITSYIMFRGIHIGSITVRAIS
jgi:hypothetical protein